ncbi:hypothetical protein Rin_00016130 [Candidatus Regiella insecticola 5.15]|uniref:Uncharacterized protein n=1 Tax=Candidatus Regiella insecticola 5.15 TaxID=1005043 RepID=G2H0N4_9ENTR|nr:hypothetical protein Rin_00016130 [Candidatus Regiella insecticola 5.15]
MQKYEIKAFQTLPLYIGGIPFRSNDDNNKNIFSLTK